MSQYVFGRTRDGKRSPPAGLQTGGVRRRSYSITVVRSKHCVCQTRGAASQTLSLGMIRYRNTRITTDIWGGHWTRRQPHR
jgi:hypothetical protein